MVKVEGNMSNLQKPSALPLSCINHVSRKCRDLEACLKFYEVVLGFVQIKRPGELGCEGHWLFNYNIGIHLLPLPHSQDEDQAQDGSNEKDINPQDDHISFQCEDIDEVEKKLQENGIKYRRQEIEEAGILLDQVFFHDPNGFMIEVCNCDQLPVVPLARAPSINSQPQLFGSCRRTSSLANAGGSSTTDG